MFDLREESELQQNLGFALEPLLGSFGPRIGRYYYETLLMDELGEEDERISFLGARILLQETGIINNSDEALESQPFTSLGVDVNGFLIK